MNIFGIRLGAERPTKQTQLETEAAYDRRDEHLRKLEAEREAVRKELSRALREIIKDQTNHA